MFVLVPIVFITTNHNVHNSFHIEVNIFIEITSAFWKSFLWLRWQLPWFLWRLSSRKRQEDLWRLLLWRWVSRCKHWSEHFHRNYFDFLEIVPMAEMTVVLVPVALVVTETTGGFETVVVMTMGFTAETSWGCVSHLLFLFFSRSSKEMMTLIINNNDKINDNYWI